MYKAYGNLINKKIYMKSVVYPISVKPHILLDKNINFLRYLSPSQAGIFYLLRYSTLKVVHKVYGKSKTLYTCRHRARVAYKTKYFVNIHENICI